jgi:N-acetyl-anhydromuramyl-L-alanine amidase AmpD
MKFIHKFKSPNFNDRESNNVNLVIIHYTAINSINESIKYLCKKENKVSAHYLISKNGKIYNLVSESNRAWHAGKSYWKGEIDINSKSIGIELDYSPLSKNTKYSNELINSLIKLLKIIIKKYKIKPYNILGHSDISPYRKIDPGNNFPWLLLEEKKITFKIQKIKKISTVKSLLNIWYKKYQINSRKKRIMFLLGYIGYDVRSLDNEYKINKILTAYNSRFKIYKNNSYNRKNILSVIELHFLNMLLTKLKK